MPQIVKIPGKVIEKVSDGLSATFVAIGQTGPMQSALRWVAETFVVSERFLPLKDIDVAKWSYFFAYFGYTDPAAFKKYAAALKPNFASLEPVQVASVAQAFHVAKYADEEITELIVAHIKENFVKWETEYIVPTAAVLIKLGVKDRDLYDAIADSIVYCNSQYSTGYFIDYTDLAVLLKGYADFEYERADLYIAVAATLNEYNMLQLSNEDMRFTVMTMLEAFEKWQFWPKNIVDLLVLQKLRPEAFGPEDTKEVERIASVASRYVDTWLFDEGYNDIDHRLDHEEAVAKKHPEPWNLYVFRDSLVPKTYTPSSIRPLK